MKLFVWNAPYPVDYGCSIIYAIAETEEQAREIIATNLKFAMFGNIYEPTEAPDASEIERSRAFAVSLPTPTRVCDLPYAEAFEFNP